MESGELVLRDAEPFELDGPTMVSGTNTDGALSGVTFSTPTISFEQQVTNPIAATAFIDAAFAQVAPGVGSVDPDGNVNVRVALRVDLTIRVSVLPASVFRCTASPVVLDLASVAPYDGERVTLRAPSFSVPPTAEHADCMDLVGDAVDAQLAGSGHSLTLNLAGELTLPLAPGEPTATTLAVAPTGGTAIGQPVTMTATVAPEDEETEGSPEGLVQFRDGNVVIGAAELGADGAPAGTAVLVTEALPAGNRRLTARFVGAPPDFAASISNEVLYAVSAVPVLMANLTPTVRSGGAAVGFDLTVINPGFGAGLADARVDVAIRRAAAPASGHPVGTGSIGGARVQLVRVVGEGDDAVEEPVVLAHSGAGADQLLEGSIGDPEGWSLAAGAERTDALRIRVAAGTDPGPLSVVFTLVRVDPVTEDPVADLATREGRITIVETQRRVSQIQSSASPVVMPVAARAGTFVAVRTFGVGPVVAGVEPWGQIEVLIDGQPVQVQHQGARGFWTDRVEPRPTSSQNLFVQIPAGTPAGQRTLTVSFLGDEVFAPSQASWPLRVEAALGTPYICVTGVDEVRLLVETTAGLPAAAAVGATVPLSDLRVTLRAPRGLLTNIMFGNIASPLPPQLKTLTVGYQFGPGGTGTASQQSRSPFPGQMTSEDGNGVDDTLTFPDSAGVAVVQGEPGQTVDVTLEEINIEYVISGLGGQYRCVPDGDGAVVGRVAVASTTLAADPAGPVREGEPVTLTAERLPSAAGVIEFLEDTQAIGHVNAPNGQATLVVDDLPVGTHEITARFLGGLTDPVTVSEPVEVVVMPGPLCPGFLQPGNGATVRLVYLELLRRCPDQAGFDFWVDRLDSFASTPEAFARSIARTPEAVGVVVNDGYQTMLGRNAEPAGKTFWVNRMISGAGRYDQLLADLGASDEFWSKAGSTNTGFVERVYDRLLHRAPDQAGHDFWVGRLDAGDSRRALILSLANLDEPLSVLVAQSYGAMLDRAPDSTERTDAIAFLRSTGDRSALYAQLIGQPEFATRAQGFPNP